MGLSVSQSAGSYDDIDGVPSMLIEKIKKIIDLKFNLIAILVDDDIDGVPMEDDDEPSCPIIKNDKKTSMPAGFVPSKWETVDPDQIEAQAMTTQTLASSKWDEDNDDSNSQEAAMDSR